MNKIRLTLACALLTAACGTASTYAQGLLDDALGPKTTATPPAVDGNGKPARPAAPLSDVKPSTDADKAPKPDNNDLISPEAAKKVDDADLLRQLTNPNGDKPDPQAIQKRMQEMLDRMNESAKRLTSKDPGDVTQETQRRIVTDLDVMIEIARQQQQQGSSSGQQQGPPKPGQQRVPGQGQGQPSNGTGGNTPAGNEMNKNDGQAEAATGDIRNHDALNWGGLPPRDRDEISHGANEEYLSAYRDMIDRYYQTLAEMGKTRGR